MEKIIFVNDTEIAILADALEWLVDTDRTLTGRDRDRVTNLQKRIRKAELSFRITPQNGGQLR